MAHPFHNYRAHKVEHERVARITKGYASGGAVREHHDDEKADKKLIRRMLKEHDKHEHGHHVDGKKPKARLDRRARGGRLHKKGTNVNVIVAPQQAHGQVPVPPMPPGAGAGIGPASPMPAPHPMPPPMPGGAPAAGGVPGMPLGPRRTGGRAYATGGAIKDGPGWTQSERTKTPVQHTDGKNDGKNVGRGRVVTFAAGGPVEAPKGKKGMAPKIGAGGHSGEARLRKAHIGIGKGGMAP